MFGSNATCCSIVWSRLTLFEAYILRALLLIKRIIYEKPLSLRLSIQTDSSSTTEHYPPAKVHAIVSSETLKFCTRLL